MDDLRRKSSLTTRATCSLSETKAALLKCRFVLVLVLVVCLSVTTATHLHRPRPAMHNCHWPLAPHQLASSGGGQTDTCLPSDPIRSLSLPLIFLYFFVCLQLSGWVDAVLFVFSLEDESSFNAVSTYYHRMIHLRSNNDNIPVFLVGTQGQCSLFLPLFCVYFSFLTSSTFLLLFFTAEGISEVTPRVISESRARKLCSEMKRCTYYETCATNGLHVDDVFDDGKSIDLYWHTDQLRVAISK